MPTPRIVVIAPNWLGDAVMSLPAIGALAGAEGLRVSVLSNPYTARVFMGVDGVDDCMVSPAGSSRLARIRSNAAALRAIGADAALILPPSFSSALAPFLARTRVRVGLGGDGRSGMLTVPVPDTGGRRVHLSDQYRGLAGHALRALGLREREAGVPAPLVTAPDDEEATALLGRVGVEGAFAMVVPGAAYGPAKTWPINRFRELVKNLGESRPVLVTGGPRDGATTAAVSDGLDGVHDVAGATSLGGLMALFRRASVVVANDSGAPHLSAALGTPTVTLFGSTAPEWTAPRGPRVSILRHPVHCSPCFRRTCPTQLECFNGIEVADVLAAVVGLSGAKKGVAETPLRG